MIPSGKNSAESIVESTSQAKKIDFHTHTDSSDGALSVRELLEKVSAAGITTLGICDHDTVSSLEKGISAGESKGITVIPGIEITSSHRRYQLHFLGYFIDYTDKRFVSKLDKLKDARIHRAKKIIAKLNRIKIPLTFESVMERAGEHNSVGRPHIANTMVEEGFAESYDEVFHKYIGIGRPAYEANYPFPPEQAIAMVAEAGGLSFLAHPSHYVTPDLLAQLIKQGLNGIEVIHPSHSEEEIAFYGRFAAENSLLKTGGSDFHGGLKNDDGNLGKYVIPENWVDYMHDRLGR